MGADKNLVAAMEIFTDGESLRTKIRVIKQVMHNKEAYADVLTAMQDAIDTMVKA